VEDESTIPLRCLKRHYVVRYLSCSAFMVMPIVPPAASVMILKMFAGSLLSLAVIVCLMTSAKKARKSRGLPIITPESSSSLFVGVC